MIWRNQEKRNQEKGSGAASAIFAVTVYSADHGRKGENASGNGAQYLR